MILLIVVSFKLTSELMKACMAPIFGQARLYLQQATVLKLTPAKQFQQKSDTCILQPYQDLEPCPQCSCLKLTYSAEQQHWKSAVLVRVIA